MAERATHLRVVPPSMAHLSTPTDQELLQAVASLAAKEFEVSQHAWLEVGRDRATVGARRFTLAYLRHLLGWGVPRIVERTGFTVATIERAIYSVMTDERYLRWCVKTGQNEKLARAAREGVE